MTDKIKVVITDNQKAVKVPTGIRLLVRRCCHAVLEMENFKGSATIGVNFTDDNGIREISKTYFDRETEGTVIALPMGENGSYDIDEKTGAKQLGSIVISMEKAVQQANVFGHTLQREIAYLTAHGVLKLLGYNYGERASKVEMREKEEWAIYQLGLPASSSYIAHRM